MNCFRNYSLIFYPPYLGSAAVLQCCRRVSTAVKMVRGGGAGASADHLQAPVRPRPQQRQHSSKHSDGAVPGVHTQGQIFLMCHKIFLMHSPKFINEIR